MNIKWEEGAPAPVRRSSHKAVWLNGLVYVGGGNEDGRGPSYTINCYDPVNNSWSSTIKIPYCYYAMTALNNKLLIAGGRDKHHKITGKILTMDNGQVKNYTKMITARLHAAAAGHQGMLIVTGGDDDNGRKLSSTELFDTSNGQWYECNDLPQPQSWLKSVIIDNILYMLGGLNKYNNESLAVFTTPLDTLPSHQLEWGTTQDTPWCDSTPVSVNGTHLLIVGGYKKVAEKDRCTSIYKLNKVTHSWEPIGQIPAARSESAAVSTADNRVIVIGGYDYKSKTNTVWIGSFEPL